MNNPGPFKIIIADDEPDVRVCLKNMLAKRCRAEVVDAADGEEAVVRAEAFRPDIILLDIRMPKLDGWGVIQKVRAFDKDVKFIVITGWDTLTDEHRKIMEDHVAAYMAKPAAVEAIVEKIFSVLGAEPGRAESVCRGAVTQGRMEAREIVHTLANVHGRVRMKCEYFVSNFQDGYFKDKPAEELLEESLEILRDIVKAVDGAAPVVEKIREL